MPVDEQDVEPTRSRAQRGGGAGGATCDERPLQSLKEASRGGNVSPGGSISD